jgi:surface protein
MKNINNYIFEKLNVKNIKGYAYFPKSWGELRRILEERLKEDENANLNDIDVSKITDMDHLFNGLDPHNIDISEWNVSNVTDMYKMFLYCENFNSDLSKWNVSNVIDMSNIFMGCDSLKNKPSWYKG